MVRLQRDLALSSSRPFDQEDARGVGSSTIFGRGPCRFGGWCLAKRERRCSGLAAKQLAAWRLQAAELAPSWGNSKRLQSWSAWAGSVALLGTDFCVAVKRSTKASTAGPNRPVEETGGESRKGILSASFISVRFYHRWHSSTTRLVMDLPIA